MAGYFVATLKNICYHVSRLRNVETSQILLESKMFHFNAQKLLTEDVSICQKKLF